MPVESRYWPLGGGLNVVDPPISVDPGHLLGVSNYEVGIRGGYRRIDGYERYDGRNRPSGASYWIVDFDAGTTAISEGDSISNTASPGSSDPQGIVLIDATVESGSFAGNDAAGFIVVTAENDATSPSNFADNDTLYVSGGSVATVDGTPSERGASTDANDQTYLRDAIETTRDQIAAITGSGNIRGVHIYDGVVYAFRDNAGATACNMWKATATGWSQVDLGGSLAFTSGGTTEIAVGDTITGATSGATADVGYVELDSGSWAGGDAAGTLWVNNVSGTFQSEDLDVGASTNLATISGDVVDTTLSAGGTYRFDNANFGGHAGTVKMYAVNGLDKAFEFDGTQVVLITTGMTTDTPSHVIEHKRHLFLAFSGGSLQHSSIGDQYTWSPVTGASELGTADEIVGLERLPGDVLLVLNRNRTYILTGSSSSDFALVDFSRTTGGIQDSVQRMWTAVYADDRGLTSLAATDAFGDFEDNTFSQLVRPTIIDKKDLINVSCISREKNQYRVFFSDSAAMYVTFDDRRVSGITIADLDHQVVCVTSEEDGAGNEAIYFGSTDGFIYQLDKGTSFDGSAISGFFRTHFNHFGTPERRKRFRRISLELDAPPSGADADITLKVTPSLSYDSSEFNSPLEKSIDVEGGGGFWNIDNWDEFRWTSPGTPKAEAKINGKGTNIAFTVFSEATYENPHTVFGVTVDFSYLRLER